MRMKLVFSIFAFALVVAGVGCSRTAASTAADSVPPGEELPMGMPISPESRIPDIPVPADFTFDREHSFVFQNSRMDVGRMQYVGKAKIGDVAQFYLDEMTQRNWTLLNVTEHGTILLFFDKADKSCQMQLTPKGRSVIVQISFFPKPSPREAEY